MAVTLEIKDNLKIVKLAGAIDVAAASELKRILLEALQSCSELCIDVGDAQCIDATGVQLLWAAEKHAHNVGISFSIAGTLNNEALAMLTEAGLSMPAINGTNMPAREEN